MDLSRHNEHFILTETLFVQILMEKFKLAKSYSRTYPLMMRLSEQDKRGICCNPHIFLSCSILLISQINLFFWLKERGKTQGNQNSFLLR